MYCIKCGKELPEGAQFCPHCGNSVSPPIEPPPLQTASGPNQDIPSTEQQTTLTAPPKVTPTAPQQTVPPVPNEEIKCPKCGAVGCVPQYKQNVSGGGYGCCQGVLGSLILGPLGLLCGACGRSVKTTNNLVWICPKCGHEFKKPLTKEEQAKMFKGALLCVRYTGFMTVMTALLAVFTIKDFDSMSFVGLLCGIVAVALMAYLVYNAYSSSEQTEEQQQELKKNIAIVGIITGVCFLLFLLIL